MEFLTVSVFDADRMWVLLATACFIVGFAYSLYALATGRKVARRLITGLLVAGFVFQTVFLYQRGHTIGRCPITNPFELLVFMSWSMVLIYLVIGSAYRLSLLGGFTAPVASAMLLLAGGLVAQDQISPRMTVNPWLEAHTSFSIVACGAFALACVAGVMYLIQEKQLKTRHPGSIFFRLPPINALAVANSRLLWLGFVLFTVGLMAGFFIGYNFNWAKVSWSVFVWCVYGGILVARLRHTLAGRWIATMSIVAFSLLLSTFWGVRFIADRASF
jgi:ABC-type uncharacterized transport system permease subunit